MANEVKIQGCGVRYPTTDGRTLIFGPGEVIGYLQLYFDYRDENPDFSTRDVIAAEFRITDSEGVIWSLTVRFTSGLFLRHTIDPSLKDSGLFYLNSCCDLEVQKSLEERMILRNIQYGEDSKISHKISISDELVELYFKLCTISFDVAAYNQDLLLVRVNDYSVYAPEYEDYIGNFGYFLPIETLLRNNTAVFDEEGEYWEDSLIPLPLVFQYTLENYKPQKSVQVESL